VSVSGFQSNGHNGAGGVPSSDKPSAIEMVLHPGLATHAGHAIAACTADSAACYRCGSRVASRAIASAAAMPVCEPRH
jgi:hypothetical protein